MWVYVWNNYADNKLTKLILILTVLSGAHGRPFSTNLSNQEAQLSQSDRATLLVIEYFAKSLKVIRNDTVE